MRVLLFLGFLLLYVAWFLATMRLQQTAQKSLLRSNNNFWIGEATLLLTYTGIFTFVFVLSGYRNWRLAAALFAVSQAGVILSLVLAGLLGSATSKWGPRGMWAGGEFALTNVPMMIGVMVLSAIVVLGYPIMTGIAFFGSAPSEVATRVFQYTLIMFFISGLGLQAPFLIGTLSSPNLHDDTRLRLFVNQLGTLVPNALWLALVFWSFGIAGSGRTIAVGDASLEFSPLLVAIMIGYFVLTTLLPYLIGAQRSKEWRNSLLDARKHWMAKVRDILETPAEAVYLSKLEALQNDLDRGIADFIERDPMVQKGLEIDAGRTPEDVVAIAEPYKLSRDEDPRFQHLDWLAEHYGKVVELRNDLAQAASRAELEQSAKEWVKYLQSRDAVMERESRQTAKRTTPALLIASSVIIPILSVLLGEFAKWLWTWFSKSLP